MKKAMATSKAVVLVSNIEKNIMKKFREISLLDLIIQQSRRTVCVTCVWAGVDNA
jgi:hypothetical protein